MSNSALVSYTKLSPNHSGKRTKRICKITPHHMAGNLSVEVCGSVLQNTAKKASSNYGIGSDGRIALYVEEENRSWASSSEWNDQQAVTIEVANSYAGGNWPVSDAAWNALVELCLDICLRNGFRLTWTGDQNGSLTCHRMFAPTACPGEYLWNKMPELAREVNAKIDFLEMISNQPQKPAQPDPINATVQPNSGAGYQRLTFEEAGNGQYRIKDKANGWYMTASGKNPNDNVDFRPATGGAEQLWKITKKRYGHADYTTFESVSAAGNYLSVENNGIGKNNLKLYTDLHNQKQKFYIREESDGCKLAIHVFSGLCVSAKA